MTHIGRPYGKKTKTISTVQDESVDVVVAYLQRKLHMLLLRICKGSSTSNL